MIDYTKSRGWRNNNPLNIRRGSDTWMGQCCDQKDKQFVQFTAMRYGYRAAFRVLQSYYRLLTQQRKPFTLGRIIARWAPGTENNTRQYIDFVAQRLTGMTGITVEFQPPTTPEGARHMGQLMAAMTMMETGCPAEAVPYHDIAMGIFHAVGISVSNADIAI